MRTLRGGHAHGSSLLRSSRGLWTVAFVVITVVLLGCGATIWDLRRNTIEEKQLAITNLGVALAEQTLRYVQVVDLVLQEVQARAAALGVEDADTFRSRLGTPAMQNYLRERLTGLPQANAFTLVTPEARILVSSRSPSVPDVDLSDRDYFRHFLTQDDRLPFVSTPVRSRTTGTPTIYIVRRMNGANNELIGMVVGAIDLQYLHGFYRAINLPTGGAVTLLRSDGRILARHPPNNLVSTMPPESPWFQLVQGNGGTYRSTGFLQGVAALVSVHPLHGWPLIINTSIQEQHALSTWRHQARVLAVGSVGAAMTFTVLFAVVARQFRRQEAQAAGLACSTAALRSGEARARDFAEMSSDWWWEADAALHLTWVSDSPITLILGFRSRLGRAPWIALNDAVNDPQWAQLCSDMAAHRSFRDFRAQYRDPAGKGHHLSVNGNPVFDSTGAFVGYRGTGREITTEVEARELLRTAKDAAEAASRAKSEFLANMSHELRTPLNAIIGFSELIRDQPFGKIGDNYVDYATDINAAGHHLLDLINDVLDLSKIEAGRYELTEEVADLSAIVRAALGMLALRARESGVRIADATRDASVLLRCDRRAIKQVVINLVGNAVKFTPNGGEVSLRITRADTGQVVLTIADTGIGIEPEALRSLCAPFQQADASIARRFGGTGLGLAISHRLLALHGATLDIASAPGEGTTVQVDFPAARVVALSGEPREAALAV